MGRIAVFAGSRNEERYRGGSDREETDSLAEMSSLRMSLGIYGGMLGSRVESAVSSGRITGLWNAFSDVWLSGASIGRRLVERLRKITSLLTLIGLFQHLWRCRAVWYCPRSLLYQGDRRQNRYDGKRGRISS